MVQIQTKYLIPLAAAALISCGSPDPKIEEYGLKTLRAVRTYPGNKCISFLYDLDDDNTIDIIEYRRWDEHGNVSAPVQAYYDKNSDKKISCDDCSGN